MSSNLKFPLFRYNLLSPRLAVRNRSGRLVIIYITDSYTSAIIKVAVSKNVVNTTVFNFISKIYSSLLRR